MGCDTRGLLKGNPTVEDVIAVLNKKKEYKVVDNDVTYDNILKTNNGYIWLKNKRMIFYSEKSLDKYETDNGEKIQVKNYSFVNLRKNEEAIEIITYLCKEFGGFIDKNDCDDKGFEIVEGKNSKSVIEQLHKQRVAEELEKLINLTKVKKDIEYKVNYVEEKGINKIEIIKIEKDKKTVLAGHSINMNNPLRKTKDYNTQEMLREAMRMILITEEW